MKGRVATVTIETPVPTKHRKLVAWVEQIAELTQPDAVQLPEEGGGEEGGGDDGGGEDGGGVGWVTGAPLAKATV